MNVFFNTFVMIKYIFDILIIYINDQSKLNLIWYLTFVKVEVLYWLDFGKGNMQHQSLEFNWAQLRYNLFYYTIV